MLKELLNLLAIVTRHWYLKRKEENNIKKVLVQGLN